MRGILRALPSPVLVIACVALFAALAGSSVAAVTQLARNSVGTPQLRSGAVTTPKLRNSAVTSAKVRNRSLLRVDFAPGQVPAGPTGPQGPAGATGPPGPKGVSDLGRDAVTSATTSVSPKSAQLACPDQKKLLGGGARLTGGGQQVALQASFPDADNIYRATAREVVATPATWSLTVYAVCANAD